MLHSQPSSRQKKTYFHLKLTDYVKDTTPVHILRPLVQRERCFSSIRVGLEALRLKLILVVMCFHACLTRVPKSAA